MQNTFGLDLFNDFYNAFYSESSYKANIVENKDSYELNMLVPGVKKENITISFEDDSLTIEIKNDKEEGNNEYLMKEISNHNVKRSFYLEKADDSNITAELKDGILKVTIGKLEPKKIEIKQVLID